MGGSDGSYTWLIQATLDNLLAAEYCLKRYARRVCKNSPTCMCPKSSSSAAAWLGWCFSAFLMSRWCHADSLAPRCTLIRCCSWSSHSSLHHPCKAISNLHYQCFFVVYLDTYVTQLCVFTRCTSMTASRSEQQHVDDLPYCCVGMRSANAHSGYPCIPRSTLLPCGSSGLQAGSQQPEILPMRTHIRRYKPVRHPPLPANMSQQQHDSRLQLRPLIFTAGSTHTGLWAGQLG